MHVAGNIPKTELNIYYLVWIGAVLYSIYCFAGSSNNFFQNYNDEYSDFSLGWIFSSRKVDTADYEWEALKFLVQKMYLWIIVLLSISEILRQLKAFKLLQFFHLFISFTFIICELGTISLVAILFQPIIFITIIHRLRNTFFVWMCNVMCLLLLAFYKNLNSNEEFLQTLNINEQQSYITILAIFWMNLKCTHYILDNLNNKETKLNIWNFFSYCFYLPTVLCGPFISYRDFKKCYEPSVNLSGRLLSLFLDIVRFLFWLLFAEFWLHFIYVNATSFQPELVETFSSWSLYGYGYIMGQFFHIKYLVLYGLSTAIAKFDNITTPSLPKCIGRIHLYSDMWKYFDRGLYNFLLKHIYIPTMNNKMFHSNKFLSSFFCFAFVYVWHGVENYILIWTTFNFIGIVIEGISQTIYSKYLRKQKFVNNLGEVWIKRLISLISSPLLAMSAISNFYFFARSSIGYIFLNRFLNDSLLSTGTLLVLLYCCCQISMELKLKHVKNKKK